MEGILCFAAFVVEKCRIFCYAVWQKRGMPVKTTKWIIIAALLLLGAGLYFLYASGFFRAATSVEGVQSYIEGFAPYSHIAFFLVQLLSVILAPIPSNITAAAGGVLFGPWLSFFMTAGAVLLGSVLVFYLARALGRSFAERFVSRKVSERYLDIIRTKQKSFLVLAFLFPFFPDDVICILAGLTDIPPVHFILIVIATRPWGLLFASALGGAALQVPLWGMVLMGIAGFGLFLLGMKYGDRVERWVMKKLGK